MAAFSFGTVNINSEEFSTGQHGDKGFARQGKRKKSF
jgi:hypothetical protein